jgi:hypothetical protein
VGRRNFKQARKLGEERLEAANFYLHSTMLGCILLLYS